VDVADVVERLMAEFQVRLGPERVAQTVLGCRRDLPGIAVGALPERLERLAQRRLLDALPARTPAAAAAAY
jgi:hypothetical protein